MTELEALTKMLDLLEGGTGVLVAGEVGSIPTIQSISHREGAQLRCAGEVVHCGFGLFRAPMKTGVMHFDGGGAMRSVEEDGSWIWSWCPLTTGRGTGSEAYDELGYDFDEMIAEVKRLLEVRCESTGGTGTA